MQPHRRRHLVALWRRKITLECGLRGCDSFRAQARADQGCFGAPHPRRCVADREEGDADVVDTFADKSREHPATDQRIISSPARQFIERKALIGLEQRNVDRGDELAGLQRRLEEVDEEVVSLDTPMTCGTSDLDLGIERQRHRRKFGCGIGERDTAAEGAAIADRGMGNERRRRVQQWRELGDQRLAQHFAMPRQRTDAQITAFAPDAAHLGDVSNVDQQPRRLQPQRQRRHEALAAGNEARVIAGARVSIQRLVDRSRPKIAESPRLHCRFLEIRRLISRDARFVTIWSQNPDTTQIAGQQEMTIWSQMRLGL